MGNGAIDRTQEWQHSGCVTALQRIAAQHRLKIRLDECGDPIIPGKRGHLYFDGPSLCLMALNRKMALRSTWEALGGKLWLGDRDGGVQDVKITGIPEENIKAAIRLAGCKPKRVMSEAQEAVLVRARESLPSMRRRDNLALESIAEGQVKVSGGDNSANDSEAERQRSSPTTSQDDGKVPW